ncbi:fungal-specific transcription factor domain-containing protein [Trichoderma evansii]
MASLACWTCRLRRKRCDRTQPVCKSCASLSISCCYSQERPEWMDGGEKQLAKTQAIKAQVKQGATARRGGSEAAIRVFSLHTSQQAERSPTVAPELSPASSPGPPQRSGSSSATTTDESAVEETENFLTTLYLDTVFPLLFPQYEPTTLSGGRSWISALLKTNKAVFHSALGTSAYYFALMLAKDATHTLRTPCEQHLWDTLAKHMEMSIKTIKHDMDQYHLQGSCSDVFSKLHVLEGVVQYLIFATAMPQGANWKIHLSAALTLLNEILQSHGTNDGAYSLEKVIQMMDKPSIFDGMYLGFRVWNNDQAAFQFYTSFLLHADVVSSIQLGQPSQLRPHYQSLIAGREAFMAPDGSTQPLPGLEAFVGCHGWVLTTLSEISEMEAKKRSSKRKEEWFSDELIRKSHYLKTKLQISMEGIDANIGPECHTTQLDSMRSCKQDRTTQLQKDIIITEIWLHAAIIYLSVVSDGWQPSSLHIREHVNSILGILDIFSSELSIRSLMLPLCISGFLAMPEQESQFRRIFSALGLLQTPGPAKWALRLIEQVWELRHELDGDRWGLYDCFQIMGSEVLLI